MQSRKYYEAYWSQYDDVVTLNEFRKMLGGLGEVQARRLLQNKTVKSFKIRGEYHIPKQCVIDYVLSTHPQGSNTITEINMLFSKGCRETRHPFSYPQNEA